MIQRMKKHALAVGTALFCVAVSLSACGGQNTDRSESTSPVKAESTSPVKAESEDKITVTDVRGQVEIPANPQRIVDLSGNSDILHILGYNVIGTANSDAYDRTKLPPFLKNELSGAKIVGFSFQDSMDIEGILPLEPDLIILSTRQEKMYDQLKTVAPAVMIELAQIDWKDDIRQVGTIFGKSKEAEQWISDYEAKGKEKGEEVKKTFGEDTTYLSILASGGKLFVFDAAGFGSILYEDMGLKRPSGMPKQENVSLPVINYEGLASIEADRILAVGTEEDMAALKADPIWNSLPAVKAGNVVELPSSPYFSQSYSCIGRSLLLDEISSLLGNTTP
ncbi:ABC transporter substrate-binding protein [Clostridium sp. HBUAS56010]|uniref:ABC transporter substrate-binding protein n=1 Tax=Clostridium sp. HBUAS56010 TaxID=2571127 RepID=UPI00325A573A